MNEKSKSMPTASPLEGKRPTRPNENGSLHIEGFVKIFDPVTKEVMVEKRA